ncbi:MAG: DUF1501 domain-containing protein [Planctomycetes bacterium]|nr:DUF1501 domain-containing protein [Planctomycetota bacterium]
MSLQPLSHRRHFLKCSAAGVAGLGLHQRLSLAAALGDGGPLAPKAGHLPARAKHLIFVFLTGGFSHVDTFDHKPRLRQDDGKMVSGPTLRETSAKPLLGSPFTFRRCGKSGLEISDLFCHLGGMADELCVIRTLHTDIVEHFQGVLAMHTGSATVPLPSLGAWLSFGLGTLNPNLPPYLVLCEHLTYAGAQVWDNSFLPPYHQGVRIVPGGEPIPDLKPPPRPATLRELEETMLRDLNEKHAQARPGDLALTARIKSFETARGMMRAAPEAFDLSKETDAILNLYGVPRGDNRSFAAQCLLARRLVERGVRVVELIDTGASNNWDSHGNMQDHRPKAQRVDQALAGLIRDLKQRGLLKETLIAVCTEFGRTPFTDAKGTKGRNHYARAFSCLLAGGGVKGGVAHGATCEYGIHLVKDPCHVHDYHATILHLMGIDHKRLTYRYAGRDFRLTDVAGNVLHPVIS